MAYIFLAALGLMVVLGTSFNMALTANKHRRNRRREQPGQVPNQSFATPTVSAAASTMTIDTDVPISASGLVPLVTVATRTIVSTTQTGPTSVDILFSGALTGLDWMIVENDPAFRTATGGFIKAACGTFP